MIDQKHIFIFIFKFSITFHQIFGYPDINILWFNYSIWDYCNIIVFFDVYSSRFVDYNYFARSKNLPLLCFIYYCIISVRRADAKRFLYFLTSRVSFFEPLKSLTSNVACLSLEWSYRLTTNLLVSPVLAVWVLMVVFPD